MRSPPRPHAHLSPFLSPTPPFRNSSTLLPLSLTSPSSPRASKLHPQQYKDAKNYLKLRDHYKDAEMGSYDGAPEGAKASWLIMCRLATHSGAPDPKLVSDLDYANAGVGTMSIQETIEIARRRWTFGHKIATKYESMKEGRRVRKEERDKMRMVKVNVDLKGVMGFMNMENEDIRTLILIFSGFSTLLSLRCSCKSFRSKIDLPLLLHYQTEIERSIDGIDEVGELIKGSILETKVRLETPQIQVYAVGERRAEDVTGGGREEEEEWNPKISAFKMMCRWGLRQHNISFFQLKQDLEIKHSVIFGMCVLLFSPTLNEHSLKQKNLLYMYVEESVYEFTEGKAGYHHNTEIKTKKILMGMIKSFLSSISHDISYCLDRICYPLLTAERRLVFENVHNLMDDLEGYKGEVWLNMQLVRGGSSGAVGYFYHLIKSVFSVCEQVDRHIKDRDLRVKGRAITHGGMINLIEREGFKRARVEREHKQVANMIGWMRGDERECRRLVRWMTRSRKKVEEEKKETERKAALMGVRRDAEKEKNVV